MRQVDDFAIATNHSDTAAALIAAINQHLRLPIHILGEVTRYNGMDITQTRDFVKISCHKYISKMTQSYSWVVPQLQTMKRQPLPFSADHKFLTRLIHDDTPPLTEEERQQLEDKMGIKYRRAMGEIMFPMIKCRPDISTHAIILSQFMNDPKEIHYQALKDLILYLAATANEGIHYWREKSHPTLPYHPPPITHDDNNYTITETRGTNSSSIIAFVDSDWATNTKKRTSITGMVIMYAGGAVGYKSKFQSVIAHSSTEAEFVAACDTAKTILFYRSLLKDIGLEQREATVLFEDNNGALLMANAQQPTRRTRHMDIKHFALLDWVEQDLLVLEHIKTSDNIADAMTKTLNKSLFYRHYNTYMGLRIPAYCAFKTSTSSSTTPILTSSGQHPITPQTIPNRAPRTNYISLNGTKQTCATNPSMGGGTRHTYVSIQ